MARGHIPQTKIMDGDRLSKAWMSMRIYRAFTAQEIAAIADIDMSQLRRYIRALLRSGHLRVVTPHRNGVAGSYTRYLLCRDTGPL